MDTDPLDPDLTTRLAAIRVPDGAERAAIELLTTPRPSVAAAPRRPRLRRTALLAAAALLGGAALAVAANLASWGPFSPPDPTAAHPYLEEPLRRLGQLEEGMTGVELVALPTEDGRFVAHYAQGGERRTVIITGPDILHLSTRDCVGSAPWPDPGPGPNGAGGGTTPPARPSGSELFTLCHAGAGAAGPRAVVLGAVGARVASAEVELADGRRLPAAVENNALLAIFPWTACDATDAARALTLRDRAGDILLRLDNTDPAALGRDGRAFPTGCI